MGIFAAAQAIGVSAGPIAGGPLLGGTGMAVDLRVTVLFGGWPPCWDG